MSSPKPPRMDSRRPLNATQPNGDGSKPQPGEMARLERFELPTNWFEASYSIQLSYRRAAAIL